MVHCTPLFGDQGHHVANVFVGADHEGLDHWFFDFVNESGLGQEGGVVHFPERAVGKRDAVDDAGIGGDNVHAVLAAESFLDNFQMEQAEEAAAEAEPQRDRGLRLIHERGIVQLQLGQVRLEMLVIGGVDGVNAAEDHRMNFLEAGQCRRGMAGVGDGVAHFDLLRAFDVGGHVAGLAQLEFFAHVRLGVEAADLFDLDVSAGVQELDLQAGLELAVEDAHVGDYAFVGVEIGIKAQGLQGRRAGRLRRWDPLHDGFEDFVNADAFLGAGQNRGIAGNGEDVLQLLFGLRDVGVRKINFIDHGDNGQVLAHGEVDVGDGLRLDALGGVND